MEEEGLVRASEIKVLYQDYAPRSIRSPARRVHREMSIVDVLANLGFQQGRVHRKRRRTSGSA